MIVKQKLLKLKHSITLTLPLLLLLQKELPSLANPSVSLPKLLYSGTQVSLNGRTLPTAWNQWQLNAQGLTRIEISDAGVTQLLGVELLNTKNAAKQPVQWFSQPTTMPLVLASWLKGAYRYLDVSQLATLGGWQLQANGDTLQITTPPARVKSIRQGRHPWGDRIVVDLDRPTPWQVREESRGAGRQGGRGAGGQVSRGAGGQGSRGEKGRPISREHLPHQEWAITIDAAAEPALIKRFSPTTQAHLPTCPPAHLPTCPPAHLETTPTLTTIRLSLPQGLSPHIDTLAHPNRLVIDIRPEVMVERDIVWAPGLRWRQQFLNVGTSRFPIVWLEINPRAVGLSLKPIWSETTTLVGIAPLLKTAQRYSAVAAINGGFFNRNNKLPLGALRRDGRWLSSPILNRGAIAWNDLGDVKIDHISLQETIISSGGQRLPILSLNSGYVQAGIARYSDTWGANYTPLVDNEIIVVVQNNQVTAQLPGGAAGITAFPIPRNGYLLALRANSAAAKNLPVGSLVRHDAAQPDYFARYPHILGAGPILLQNRQIVLNAKAEGFSDAFIRETAARSAIGTTVEGTLLIAAVHNRTGGAGPTLTEIARIMQQLGCVDALNLDGGSSTSLYLGGQLLNRSPRTAARIHNGLGVFIQPRL